MSCWIRDKNGIAELAALKAQVSSLANNTLKNNLQDQLAAGLRVSKTPSDNLDVIRVIDTKYNTIIDNSGALNANQTHEFTPSGMTFSNGFYHFFFSALVGNIDCTFSVTLRKLNRDSFTNKVEIPKTIDGTDFVEFRVGIKSNGKVQVRCNNSFAYFIGRVHKVG